VSILSDAKIIEKIYDHELIIEPFVLENIQPSSVDLTLSPKIKIPKKYVGVIDVYREKNLEQYFEEKEINGYVLEPDSFIIGQINETIGFSKNLQGNIQNRNSVIRAGIDVGLSTYITPGYFTATTTASFSTISTYSLNFRTTRRIKPAYSPVSSV
jgi:deoxycytidine triphosphate deaminase